MNIQECEIYFLEKDLETEQLLFEACKNRVMDIERRLRFLRNESSISSHRISE